MQLALFDSSQSQDSKPVRPISASHRRLLKGVIARRVLEMHPELEELFNAELNRFLTRPEDRALFGLSVPFQLVLSFQLEFKWPESAPSEWDAYRP